MHTVALIAASVFVAAGIPLAFVPMFPTLAYMLVVAILFGFYDGFTTLTLGNVLALGGFVVVSFVVDNLAGLVGAKYGGAHAKSLLWGVVGAFLGTLLFPPLGSLGGLFVAVLVAEMRYRRDGGRAVRAASGALVGAVAGIAINVLLGVAFLVTFILVALS